MTKRRFNRKSNSGYPVRDLSYVTDLGGRTRRHKYWEEIRIFFWPVLICLCFQAVVYSLFITRAGRGDWENITIAITALSCVPVLCAAVLTAFRRHEAPIVIACVVSAAMTSVVVTGLSALRIPISYQGLMFCLPVAVVLMAYANLRFHRTLSSRVALAPFSRASEVSADIGGMPVLSGNISELDNIDILLVDPLENHSKKMSSMLAACYLGGIEIMPWTRYIEVRRGRLDVSTFEVTHLSYSPSQLLYARVKRLLDLAAVIVSLPLTLPIAALVAVYLFARDGNPVIFVQIRRGYGGRRFRMYKFRTMYKGTSGGSTGVNDKRIIPGCELLRKLRFDEIPQLVNILWGDMSLIGPRPVAEYVSRSSEIAEPKYALRSLVLPGITGWAQVKSGYAGTTEEEIEKLSYDLYYIKHLSFDLDLLVLFKTVKTVFFGLGAR